MVVLHRIEHDDAGLIAALARESLPGPGAGRYFGAHHHGAVVGYVALEGERPNLLLRSLVVLQEQKARGLGRRVLGAAEAVARELGAERLHLLTTTAEAFFIRDGYRAADRGSAPSAIRQTREFEGLCPAAASYLTKDL